jgi:hypothetical protein
MKKIILLSLLSLSALAQNRIQLKHDEAAKRVEVTVDGKPFTAYIYPGPAVLKKPVLYPIRTAGGNFITRGWPMDPRPGERVDHPHHVGMWLNYGDVNGHDFWNNSTDIAAGHGGPFGTVVHTGVQSMKSGKDQAELVVTAAWLDKDDKPMLRERTTYVFGGSDKQRTIDRITTLTALDKDILFKDNKEGMVAIRLARELEHPSNKAEVFTDANGIATKVPVMASAGITGNYHSSEGVEGEAVWGKRARWMNLTGKIGQEDVSVVMMDHPKNVGYPTYWHARGYGLYAANPLAPAVFTNNKEAAMNYTLEAGKSVTFQYRIVINSESAEKTNVEMLNKKFVNK